jgi:adenylate cyclase
LSNDPDQEYFSDGISEDIITALSRVRSFFVIARNTTFTYKGKAVDVQAVAKELGVHYVLEGSVRKAGNRVRITTQLIDGETGNHLWAEKYDRELEDIFALQDEITVTVVGAIEPELGKAELERGKTKNRENLNAWDLYHRGVAQLYRWTEKSISSALDYFNQAIQEDPGFAAAHARYAEAVYSYIIFGFSSDLTKDRAETLRWSRKAVELDRDDPEAHLALGMAQILSAEFSIAMESLERALELNPSSPLAHSFLGLALTGLDRFDEAIQHQKTAIQIGNRNPALSAFMGRLGHTYEVMGDYESSIDWIQKAIQLQNHIWVVFAQLAHCYVRLDRMDDARRTVETLVEKHPGITANYTREFMSTWPADQKPSFVADLIAAGLPED